MSFSIVTTSFGIAEKPQTKCSSCQKNSVKKLARTTIKKLHPYVFTFLYLYGAESVIESLSGKITSAEKNQPVKETLKKVADIFAAVMLYEHIKTDAKYVEEKLGSICSYFFGAAENEENQEQEITA